MKTHFHICLTIICICAFAFIGCTSKEYSFNVEVKGETYKVFRCDAVYDKGLLHMNVMLTRWNYGTVWIMVLFDKPGTYILNSDSPHNLGTGGFVCYSDTGNNHKTIYTTDNLHTGAITISSLDEEEKTISGTFEFQAIRKEGGSDVVNVKGAFENVPSDNDRSRYPN